MTRDEMLKVAWKPYMLVHYEPGHGSDKCYEMTLIGIEFDDEAIHCVPFDIELYEPSEYYINIKFIKLPKQNMDTLRIITNKAYKVDDSLKNADRSEWGIHKGTLIEKEKPINQK